MTTDLEAREHGIDPLANVADGIIELRKLLLDYRLDRSGVDEARTLNNVAAYLCDKPETVGNLSTPEKTREELIVIRNGLLDATQFHWAVLCTHALWWLSEKDK